VARLWEPLCLAALNVRLNEASACVFLTVLRDSLGARSADSHLLVARGDMSALFPDAACRALVHAGVQAHWRTPVQALSRAADRWEVITRGSALSTDQVILAVPPPSAARLLCTTHERGARTTADTLAAVAMAPICTVYLKYAVDRRLPWPVMALREAPEVGSFGQWVFDRGALAAAGFGVLSVVVSGTGAHRTLSHDAIGTAVGRQLTQAFGLPPPLHAVALTDKHATVVPRPGLQRPPSRVATAGLYVAADAADSPYPSTLEGSVRAGIRAAEAAMDDWARERHC